MKPIRIEEGITQLGGKLIARVKVGGVPRKQRFDLTTPIEAIRRWRTDTQAELEDDRRDYGEAPATGRGRPAIAAQGSLESDGLGRYVPQIQGRPSTAADTSHLRAWFEVVVYDAHLARPVRLGSLPRAHVTYEHVNLAIAQWRTAPTKHAVRRVRVTSYTRDGVALAGYERTAPLTSGRVVADRTIRHRCRVLADVYHTLDGAKAPTPLEEAKVPAVPKSVPVGLDVSVVIGVAIKLAQAALPRARVREPRDPEAFAARERARARDRLHTYVRFVVLATTGQRPCQVMRAEPTDVNLEVGTWLVRSAKFEPAHTITLTADMRQAWQAFVAAAAWGPFDTTTQGNRVHAAGWPAGVRPYNVRHSLMMDALALGIDLGDVQGLAGHTSPLTTRRTYGPLAIGRQREVSNRLEGRLAEVFTPRLVKGGP